MRILLIATGGTIAGRPDADGAVTTALSGAEVLSTVTGIDIDGIEVVDVASVSSWNLEPDKRAEIAVRCRLALEGRQADAVIVTHGTDTVEETAWLTELLASRATAHGPVVFTAAMRHAAALAADGPANLRDAILLARSRSAGDRGVMLCANGEVHHARWVTKTDAHALDTFRSPAAAPLGRVIAGRVAFTLASPAPPPSPPDGDTIEHHVALVPSYAGLDGDVIDFFVTRGARGIVVEGTGAGNLYRGIVPGIERAIAAGIPVVVTTRCLTGPVAPVYGGEGGGARLADMGVTFGGDLGASKARLALMVALGGGASIDAVRAWFGVLTEPVTPSR